MTEFYVDDKAPHLGGYIVGGDESTMYPELWEWLVRDHLVHSVIDVGCGEGWALRYFERMGCAVLGIDGVPQEHPRIIKHDYTMGPWPVNVHVEPPDLVWSCEFVEHIDEIYVPNFLETFKQAPLVMMTHAEPGQMGHHHVNCQTADYWRGVMAAIGYRLDYGLTVQTRTLASLNQNPYNHFARSGLAFIR